MLYFQRRITKSFSCEGETIFAYDKVSERTCCKDVSDAVGIQGEIVTIWGNQKNVYREFMIKTDLEREVVIAQKDNAMEDSSTGISKP